MKSLFKTRQPDGGDAVGRFLRRGSAVSMLLKVAATGVSFLTGIFLARTLGPSGYGIYAYAMAVVTLLSTPAALGLPQLLIRQIAAYESDGEWELMRGLLRWSSRVTVVAATVLVALAALGGWLFAGQVPVGGLPVFWLSLVMVPLLALGALRVAALQGLHRVILAQLPEGLLRPGLFLIVAGIAYLLLGQSFEPLWAMGLQVAATAAAFGIGTAMLWRLKPAALRHAGIRIRSRAWRASALPLLIISGVFIINTNADLLMLGWFGAAHDVGVYRVATRGAQVVLFFLMAANLAAAPVFSRLYHQNERAQLQHVITLTARMILLVAVPLALLLIFFGAPILELLFGSDYVSGATALAILAGGQLVNAATGSASELLMMTGFERANARVAGFGVAMNVGLNAVLIPPFGIDGAATATAISTAAVNLLLAWSARRHLRVDPTAIGRVPT